MATNSFTGYQPPCLPQSNAPITLTGLTAGDITLTANDSGKIIFLPDPNASRIINLPVAQPGLHFTFIMKDNIDGIDDDITLNTEGASQIYGILYNIVEDAVLYSPINGDGGVAFLGPDVGPVIQTYKGDTINLTCDGTNWYVYGFSRGDGLG